MNERFIVQVLVQKDDNLTLWITSGYYETFPAAQKWAEVQLQQENVLAVRINRHQWIEHLMWEQRKGKA